MARYTGARLKIVRRLKADLPGLTRKSIGLRKNPPGQHGANARKGSDYGMRLLEKQKVKFNYGLSEKSLRHYFSAASRSKNETGKELMAMLESRLDNIVFRAGFAPTIPAARQLVCHGHVLVNGKRINYPGRSIKPGDVVTIREQSRAIPMVTETIDNPSLSIPTYLKVESKAFSAEMTQRPQSDDAPIEVQLNMIIELYSRVGL
jgi:small subunit ribosomal protein S4